MTVLLVVFTDGRRDCIERAVPSALANLQGLSGTGIVFDDSGDPGYGRWLRESFGLDGFHVSPSPVRLGFGGSVRRAWRSLARPFYDPFDHVFHLEDDFTFNGPVDLAGMAHVLDANPHLAQMALRRQAWNDEERAAGGIVESHPTDYVDRVTDGHEWLEHRRFFTTNPSLYRRTLCEMGWPDGGQSEGMFSARLFSDPKARCGYWASRSAGPQVEHIGRERVGSGY